MLWKISDFKTSDWGGLRQPTSKTDCRQKWIDTAVTYACPQRLWIYKQTVRIWPRLILRLFLQYPFTWAMSFLSEYIYFMPSLLKDGKWGRYLLNIKIPLQKRAWRGIIFDVNNHPAKKVVFFKQGNINFIWCWICCDEQILIYGDSIIDCSIKNRLSCLTARKPVLSWLVQSVWILSNLSPSTL